MRDCCFFVGIIMIVLGVIFCFTQLSEFDFDAVFGYNYGFGYNQLDSLERGLNKMYLLSTIIATVSMFLVGLFFMAVSKIIELLENLQKPQKDPQIPQKPVAPNRMLIVKKSASKQA